MEKDNKKLTQEKPTKKEVPKKEMELVNLINF
jgi:hypothetical protein